MSFKSLLTSIKQTTNEYVGQISSSTKELVETVKSKIPEKKPELTKEEQGKEMVKVLDATFLQTNDLPENIEGQEMAKTLLKKNKGNINETVKEITRLHVTSTFSNKCAVSLEKMDVKVDLPTNTTNILSLQMRMIEAIASLSDVKIGSKEYKNAVYLCLLGAEGPKVLSEAAGAVDAEACMELIGSMTPAMEGKLLSLIGEHTAEKFVLPPGIAKLIPFFVGLVQGSLDAIATFSIARMAKALFLGEILDIEEQDNMELARMQVMVNMLLVDGKLDPDELQLLKELSKTISVSEKGEKKIEALLDKPKCTKNIDFAPFKQDTMLSACILGTLKDLAMADGKFQPAERIYFDSVAKELGYKEEDIQKYFA